MDHGQRDPFERFRRLLAEAEVSDAPNANAMVVCSVDPEGQPSSRIVLLKGLDDRGFVFFTNFESRKGREILANPRVSLNFFWRKLDRQVVVLGAAERVSDQEADEYFGSRPRGSQLGAWASQQSRELSGRAHLLAEVAKVAARYLGRTVPRPPHWSGFRVIPSQLEFWVSGEFRLHERTLYRRDGEHWQVSHLFP